jgi:hypothetical protein
MAEVVVFRHERARGLLVALRFLAAGVAVSWLWWDAVYGLDWGNRGHDGTGRKESG